MKNKTGPLDFEFNTNDITSAIKSLKLNKTNFGIVTNEILQCSPKTIALPLCCMFNFILRSKTFPEAWNLSRIKPIHKSGSLSKPDNYRGICISSHLSKLFTALLHKRLEKWTAVNNILPNNSNRRWNFYLNNCIEYAKKGQKVYSCFVDFAKFYDSINHNLLFLKLAKLGISGNFYFLLKNMYMNCSYAIKVSLPLNPHSPDDNQIKRINSYQWYKTTSFKTKSGLKQGCNLSPLLANIFLSDLHENLEQDHIHAPKLNKFEVTSVSWQMIY